MNTPTLTLDVDLTNPGQYLACCGLLELASCVDPETMGWFEGSQFRVSPCGGSVLSQFIDCEIYSTRDHQANGSSASESLETDEEQKEEKSPPLLLGAPFNLVLDWWEDPAAGEAGFKTWSAGMTVLGFFNGTTTGKGDKLKVTPGMRKYLDEQLSSGGRMLQEIRAIQKPSPFNFDSRVSRNTAVDLGFTGEGIFTFSPAVELLAMIGLQCFRPRMETRWERNTYCTWGEPLPVKIAAAVANGLVPTLTHECYWFSIIPRDSQGRYKAFGPAQLERNFDHE